MNSKYTVLSIRVLTFLWIALVALFIANFLFPLPEEKDYSRVILDSKGRVVHAALTDDDKWRMHVPNEHLTEDIEKAILAKEDRYFYYHPGVNPISIVRALFHNIRYGYRTSGASTLTMQLARLQEPRPRTYGSKLIEIFRAFQYELTYTKREILRMYVNYVPFGGNIEGFTSASVLYYGKQPNHLSLAQLTALTIVPNRPQSWIPGTYNDALQDARDRWLVKFRDKGVFDDERIEQALGENLDAHRRPAPREIPHLAYRLQKDYPNILRIQSTIDSEVQSRTARLVKRHAQHLRAIGVDNACALVMDNRNHRVLAYVGSADFYNNEIHGQVDGIRGLRQPGSTLKPFIYGLAFDEGLLTPLYQLTDVPTQFDGYEPVNYDGTFRGYVTVEEALRLSLNIPAVKALDKLSVSTLLNKLEKADFQWIANNKEKLGLSVALGGCGVTLEELTGLYSAFANDGVYTPMAYTMADTLAASDTLYSAASNYMVTAMLTTLDRPDYPNDWQQAPNAVHPAWKTGTSYGRKDAWAIGYTEDLTIGVWCGNFSGKGSPELTGAGAATPLLFRLFQALSKPGSNLMGRAYPKALSFRAICSHSGLLPGENCVDQTVDYYIPLVSSTATCQHMESLAIAPDSSISYCAHCKPSSGYKEALFTRHPPEMITYFQVHDIPYDDIPPHNPQCNTHHTGYAPEITSPVGGTEYLLDVNGIRSIAFTSRTSAETDTVFWFLDDALLGPAKATETLFYDIGEGDHKVTCVDEEGRKATVRFTVTFME